MNQEPEAAPATNKIEWNLWINDYQGVQVKGKEGEEPVIEMRVGKVTADQHAALHIVIEVARCLLMGKSIDHTFNPTLALKAGSSDQPELVKCKWFRSGKLVIIGKATRQWRHANTPIEAVERQRVFTCTREVYEATPKRRQRPK